MKTRDLILLLEENDPSGEAHVTVGGADIQTVRNDVDYPVEELLKKDGIVTGGRYITKGKCLNIVTAVLEDFIWDNLDFPIDFSELDKQQADYYKKDIENTRNWLKQYYLDTEIAYFYEWCRKKTVDLTSLAGRWNELKEVCKLFMVENNINRFTPMDTDDHLSYLDNRYNQWEKSVNVSLDDMGNIVLRKVCLLTN